MFLANITYLVSPMLGGILVGPGDELMGFFSFAAVLAGVAVAVLLRRNKEDTVVVLNIRGPIEADTGEPSHSSKSPIAA